MKHFFTTVIACVLALSSQAGHIIGGDFSIQHVEGNTFQAILHLYRDCGGSGADFDPTVDITAFDLVTDAPLLDLDFVFTDFTSVDAELGNSCFTPNVCMQIGTYIAEIDITDNPNGYYFSKERCCRNTLSLNIPDADLGFVFTLDFPDAALQNSSPLFNPYPTEAFLCVNAPVVIDFGATDVDGDSLVYSFTDPLRGVSDAFNANPVVASSKPYAIAPWGPAYSTFNQIGGANPMTINPETGIIEGQPTEIGFFTLAVKVEEFRDGIKIGEIRREIQLESSVCAVDLASEITTEDNETSYVVLANTDFCIEITATDVNEGDVLFLEAEGELFDGTVTPLAEFESVNGESTVTQTFCWSPLCHNVSDEPYTVTFRAFSEGCAPEILITTLDIDITVILDEDEPTEIVEPATPPIIDLYDPSTHCFNFVFEDPNEADTLYVTASSPILGLDNVEIEVMSTDQGEISIPFCWDVECINVQDDQYFIDFEVNAVNCNVNETTFFTVPIEVIVQPNIPSEFVQPTQEYYWEFYSESEFCMPVMVTDDNHFDTLNVTAQSTIFQTANPAVFEPLNGTSMVEGSLCWTPTCADVRPEPYQVFFTAAASSCKTNDQLVYPVDIYLTLPPENAAEFSTPAEGTLYTHYIGDDILYIPVLGTDSDPYDTLSLHMVTPAGDNGGSSPVFEYQGVTSAVTGDFNWNPSCLNISNDEYPVTFILTSRSCQKVRQIETTVNVFVTTQSLGNIEPVMNVMTPNGDGYNDEWTIENQDDPCLLNFNAQVFDRWGKEVFVTDDPAFYWDGDDFGAGTYYRIIEFTYVNDTKTHSGNIQILK